MQLVGDLMSRYNPTMTTPRFKIMLPPQQVFDLLTQFYIIEVKRRHVEMEIDETTEANLNAVTDALPLRSRNSGFGSMERRAMAKRP